MDTNDEIIDPIGCKVKIQWDDGSIEDFEIVEKESSAEGKVACDSAFALSLTNKKQGDTVTFFVGKDVNTYTILEVQLGPNKTRYVGNSVERCIAKRNLTKLYHFTAVENLSSIFRYGILSRSVLDARGIAYCANDMLRLENRKYLISCSLEYPNNSLLWKYSYDSGKDFCQLELDIRLLIDVSKEKDSPSRCSTANAARRGGSMLSRISEVESLFGGTRNPELPPNYTTNAQAEILFYNKIPVEYIKRAIFRDTLSYSRYAGFVPHHIPAVIVTELFDVRPI